ncbi:MAG: hypothetical protein ACOCPM_01630 [Bacteroidales bacterium]
MKDPIENNPGQNLNRSKEKTTRSAKTCSVKSTGKLFYTVGSILLFYFVIVLFILLTVLGDQPLSSTDLWKIFILPFVIAPLFIIAWIVVVPGMVFQKKIPLQVNIKPYQAGITLTFPRKKQISLAVDEFAFTFHRNSLHNVLIFYKIVPSRNGRLVFQKIATLIGLPVGPGWKKETLTEIANYLHQNGYQYHREKN